MYVVSLVHDLELVYIETQDFHYSGVSMIIDLAEKSKLCRTIEEANKVAEEYSHSTGYDIVYSR